MWVRPPPSVHFSEAYIAIGMGIKVDIEKAKQIIFNNSQAGENSFVFDLHERQVFTEKLFWEYYDSIETLVSAGDTGSAEVAAKITDILLTVLKHIIWHFDPNDNYVIADLPREYPDYLDRLEYALIYISGRNHKSGERSYEQRSRGYNKS